MKTITTQLVASPPSTDLCHTDLCHTDLCHTDLCHIVAADHPSLDRNIESFLERLPFERRSFIRTLTDRGGFRLAAIRCGRVVGLARIDDAGELNIAVTPEHRGSGIGTMLGRAALERAITLDYSRVAMRTTRRSRAARRVGEAMGCVVVENARGRTDLIAHLPTGLRSA